MSVQFSVAVRNTRLDAIETTIGASPKLQLRTGAPPANCASARTGTLLAQVDCPADFMAAAADGSKVLAGAWPFVGVAAGVAAHYSLMDSTGATCHEQGTVTLTGAGGDMTLDNTNIAVDQAGAIATFTKTEPHA